MNEVKKTWYAVTNEKERSYEWDNGSFSYDEAVKILEEQGEGELVTVEIRYENDKMIDYYGVERAEYNDIF